MMRNLNKFFTLYLERHGFRAVLNGGGPEDAECGCVWFDKTVFLYDSLQKVRSVSLGPTTVYGGNGSGGVVFTEVQLAASTF
jgi:hypothetical protein